MKTTIVIADDLLKRTKELARRQKTTFRALTEEGLRMVLQKKDGPGKKNLPPLVVFGRGGMTPEFKDAGWDKLRDEIYSR